MKDNPENRFRRTKLIKCCFRFSGTCLKNMLVDWVVISTDVKTCLVTEMFKKAHALNWSLINYNVYRKLKNDVGNQTTVLSFKY